MTETTTRPRALRLLGLTAGQHAKNRAAVIGTRRSHLETALARLEAAGPQAFFDKLAAETPIALYDISFIEVHEHVHHGWHTMVFVNPIEGGLHGWCSCGPEEVPAWWGGQS